MSGIFYDPRQRRLRRVDGAADHGWMLVTHNLQASAHHCRRIMREWLAPEDLVMVDWSGVEDLRSA